MFTYPLAEPRHPVASALQATFLHASLIAGAVWVTKAAPIVHGDPGPVDLTWTTSATVTHPTHAATVILPSRPTTFSWNVPTLPPIGLPPVVPGQPLVDPTKLIPGGTPAPFGSDLPDSAVATTVLAESQVDELPELIASGALRYPAVLRESGIEGSVTVTFIIDAEGRVEPDGVQVLAATQQGFVPAATEAVLTSRFRPARKGHSAVRVRVRQVISFKL